MSLTAPRRLAALMALLCVLAGCRSAQERSVPLSAVVNAPPTLRGKRVQTTGIVTYSDPDWRVLFVQDGDAGMYITLPPQSEIQFADRLRITGTVTSHDREPANSSEEVLSRSSSLPAPAVVKDYSALPALISRLAEVGGTVRWVGDKHGRALIRLSSGRAAVFVYLRQALEQELPTVGSEVKVSGVVAADSESDGNVSGPKLFAQSTKQISIVKAGPSDLFATPTLERLSNLKNKPMGTLVHIVGDLVSSENGLAVKSEGLSIPVKMAQPTATRPGIYEIAGFWTGEALEDALFRPVNLKWPRHDDITRLMDLKRLNVAQASLGRPVSVRAAVTYVDREWGLLFVQDDTAAAYVNFHSVDIHLQPGDIVDISGVSGPGGYAPQIEQPRIVFVRRGELPKPIAVNPWQQNAADVDSKWSRFQGVVHTAEEQNGRSILEIGAGPSDVTVTLPVPIHAEELLDREVSATGVFGVLFNDRRQAIGHQIFVPSPEFLKVTDDRVGQAEPVTILSLQRYSPNTDQRHSVVVNGTVILKADDSTIFVEDRTAGIQVRGVGQLKVTDGDHVSIRGFVANGEYSPVLAHGVVTARMAGNLPASYAITAKSALGGQYDSEYVSMRANLDAVRPSPDGTILVLNDNGTLFEAFGPANDDLNALRPGSELEIRGICRVQVEPTQHSVRGFNLAFDSQESVSVLRMGPWWDTRKITWVLFAIALVSALASLWIMLLRQNVETKTRELRSSVEAKRKAQRFDVARNQVLEAIARNAPPPESMEYLALAVQEQIEGSVCAIALSPDGKSFLDGKPSAVLVAPNLPDDLQRQILPALSSVLINPTEGANTLPGDADVMTNVLEKAKEGGVDFCDADVVVAFSGAGDLAGLIMVFFKETPPADPDHATRVLQSASRLVSLARDHWYMHERLVFDARHDALTGLPNRTVSEDRLDQALARAQRRRQMFAVLCIDLDGFKSVNDNHGHHAGDELLRVVSARLRARIRHSDTLARIGGDEFLAIIEDCNGDTAAQAVGESLVASLLEPVNLEGRTVSISGSIGIAMYPTDGKHAAELKRNADQAMYRAKASGRGKICFWSGQPLATRKATPASSNLS